MPEGIVDIKEAAENAEVMAEGKLFFDAAQDLKSAREAASDASVASKEVIEKLEEEKMTKGSQYIKVTFDVGFGQEIKVEIVADTLTEINKILGTVDMTEFYKQIKDVKNSKM